MAFIECLTIQPNNIGRFPKLSFVGLQREFVMRVFVKIAFATFVSEIDAFAFPL